MKFCFEARAHATASAPTLTCASRSRRASSSHRPCRAPAPPSIHPPRATYTRGERSASTSVGFDSARSEHAWRASYAQIVTSPPAPLPSAGAYAARSVERGALSWKYLRRRMTKTAHTSQSEPAWWEPISRLERSVAHTIDTSSSASKRRSASSTLAHSACPTASSACAATSASASSSADAAPLLVLDGPRVGAGGASAASRRSRTLRSQSSRTVGSAAAGSGGDAAASARSLLSAASARAMSSSGASSAASGPARIARTWARSSPRRATWSGSPRSSRAASYSLWYAWYSALPTAASFGGPSACKKSRALCRWLPAYPMYCAKVMALRNCSRRATSSSHGHAAWSCRSVHSSSTSCGFPFVKTSTYRPISIAVHSSSPALSAPKAAATFRSSCVAGRRSRRSSRVGVTKTTFAVDPSRAAQPPRSSSASHAANATRTAATSRSTPA